MSSHTKPTAVLANRDRLVPGELPLEIEARAVWLTVTKERDIMRRITAGPFRWVIYRLRRKDHRSDPLVVTAQLIVWLANAGVSEAMLRLIPLYLTRVIECCFAGRSHRSLDEIDRDEQVAESRENQLALERRITNATPEQLETEAAANEAEACVNIERARVLRRLKTRMLSFPGTALTS